MISAAPPCSAILAAMADAGLEVNDIDGLVRYTWDNTTEAAIVNALGLPSLKYYGETEFGGVSLPQPLVMWSPKAQPLRPRQARRNNGVPRCHGESHLLATG